MISTYLHFSVNSISLKTRDSTRRTNESLIRVELLHFKLVRKYHGIVPLFYTAQQPLVHSSLLKSGFYEVDTKATQSITRRVLRKLKRINSLLIDYINVREYRRGIKNGQSRETGNIGYTKQKHNTICVEH